MNLKAFDWQHVVALFLTPCASAFLDYEVNSAAPFSKTTLQHAALATALVAVAVFDKDLRAKMAAGASMFLLVLTGCGGASVPTAPSKAMSTTSTQALARGAVETAMHIWEDAVDACRAYADSQDAVEEPKVLTTCRNALLPARDSLVLASTALDSWTDASQGDVACAVADVVSGVQQVAKFLKPSPEEQALITDAAELSKALSCPALSDGGAG